MHHFIIPAGGKSRSTWQHNTLNDNTSSDNRSTVSRDHLCGRRLITQFLQMWFVSDSLGFKIETSFPTMSFGLNKKAGIYYKHETNTYIIRAATN